MIRNLWHWTGRRVFQSLNPGYYVYGVIPAKDAITYLVNERLRNNLPRYRNQVHRLSDLREIEVSHLGLSLKYELSLRSVTLTVLKETYLPSDPIRVEKLSVLPWRRKSSLMRFMAEQEATLWP